MDSRDHALTDQRQAETDALNPFCVTVLIEKRGPRQNTVGYRSALVFARSLDEAVGKHTRQTMNDNPGDTVSAGDGFALPSSAEPVAVKVPGTNKDSFK